MENFELKKQSKFLRVILEIKSNAELRKIVIVYCLLYNLNEFSKKFNAYILTQPID